MVKNKPLSNAGFTLFEVIIAMAILTLALASILAVESNSLTASARAKQMNIVAMLVKNKMIETEFAIQGKPFDEVEKEKTGSFDAPYEEYSWKRLVKEVEFPSINPGGESKDGSEDQTTATLAKLVTNFLSKSIREVSVSVIWKKSGRDQNFTVSTYWVDLNHAFDLSQ